MRTIDRTLTDSNFQTYVQASARQIARTIARKVARTIARTNVRTIARTIASTIARATVSCLRNARVRRAVREPPDLQLVSCLSFEKHDFLNQFLERIVSHKRPIWSEHALQKVLKMVPKIDFFPNLENLDFCDPSHTLGHVGPPRNHHKSNKKRSMIQVPLFFIYKNSKLYEK